MDYPVSSYRMDYPAESDDMATPFAKDLCVVDEDILEGTHVDMAQASAAALFCINNSQTIYAKNVHEKLAPASLTKLMTALVALKYSSPDTMLTASANVKINESGAQLCGLREGDQMTLAQALHVLLINSANDAVNPWGLTKLLLVAPISLASLFIRSQKPSTEQPTPSAIRTAA